MSDRCPLGYLFYFCSVYEVDLAKVCDACYFYTKCELTLKIASYLFSDVHEALNYVGKYCKKETEVTVMIVNHLLLRITPNARCILDRGFTYNLDNECPDGCEVKLKNTKSDDTTIGRSV